MVETILLVDDDAKMKNIVAEVLRAEGFSMLTAMNGRDALRIHAASPVDLVLLDIKLPDIDGIELLKQLVDTKPAVPVVMISGFATIDRAVSSTRLGAYDFLEKPLEPARVLLTIKNALERTRLAKSQQALLDEMMSGFGIVGASESMRVLCTAASRIAKLETPVLITGENGTGKELLARIIHRFSGRKTMISMNCAAVPRELVESELFGHRKGSFTGAIGDKTGKFQAADGGTLFLDEIGDMSRDMQAKILRALETREITMVGGNDPVKVDVRFIAATNKDIPEAIRQGEFREDLYYRLKGVLLTIPPLRERVDAIKPMAEYFLEKFCTARNIPVKRLTPAAADILASQPWRGNVRELKHFIETAAIFSDEATIDHLQIIALLRRFDETAAPNGRSEQSLRESTISFEKTRINEALSQTDGNITRAAALLNIDRATLSKKIKRLGIKAG